MLTKAQAAKRLGVNETTFDAARRVLGIQPAKVAYRMKTVRCIHHNGVRTFRRPQRYVLFRESDVRRILRTHCLGLRK